MGKHIRCSVLSSATAATGKCKRMFKLSEADQNKVDTLYSDRK